MFDQPSPPDGRAAPIPAPVLALQQHPFFASALATLGRVPIHLPTPAQSPNAPPFWLWHRRWMGLPLAMISRATFSPTVAAQLPDRLTRAGLANHLLILSPEAPSPHLAALGAVPLMTPAHLAELDLTPTFDARLAQQHPKWRNRLRHAQNAGLRVSRTNLPPDPSHWLLKAEAKQQSKRGYRGWPPTLSAAYALANKGQAKLFEAREGAEVIAALVILCHRPGATYQIGHTTPRGRALSAHNLLMWEAADWLARQGYARLDLGLIDWKHLPGLARFKLGCGAQARKLGGTWGWLPRLGRSLRPLAWLDQKSMAA